MCFVNYKAPHSFKISFLTRAVTTVCDSEGREREREKSQGGRQVEDTDVETLQNRELVEPTGNMELGLPGASDTEV